MEITLETIIALTAEEIEGMNKNALKEHLIRAVELLKVTPTKGPGRKGEVLAVLKEGPATILEIANKLGTSSKNVSSQLTALRKAGHIIHTDERSRKFLAAAPVVVVESAEEQVHESSSLAEI